MKKNKAKIIVAIVIVLVLTLGIAISYAYFSTSDKQGTANTFRSGCLNITIETESSAITLDNAYPISDLEGIDSKGYTFTIKNTCNKDTNYMINLESLNESSNTLDSNYLKVALESDTMDNLISKLGDNPTTEALITGAYEAHNLYNGTILANETKEFTLREWIDYDVTKEQGMNKTVTNKINVIARPDLEVEDLAEIKTTYNDLELTANVTGGGILKEENKIVSTTNDETYPFSYNEETKKYTSTNKVDGTTSTITFKVEKAGDVKICYEISSEGRFDKAIFYVGDEQVDGVSGEQIGCITLENVGPDSEIKVEYSKDSWGGSSGKDEVSFSIELLPIYQLPIKYCISDKNNCEPNKDTNVVNDKVTIDLNPKEQLVCIKLNNDKIYCNKKDKLPPILANGWFGKQGTENAITKPDVESITTLDKISIPENAIKFWDASEKGNRSVMAYYRDADSNGKYELYLAGDGGVIAPTNSSYLFSAVNYSEAFNNVTKIDLINFDTRNVTNMSKMFWYMSSLTSLDVSNFNTSNVTNMGSMFSSMKNLISLDVSNFDTSNVTNMSYMFQMMKSITSLNVSNFNTSNVTNMGSMFSSMESLTSLDVSNFDTSKVTDMSAMFNYMNKLVSLDVTHFDTSNVTNMSEMFEWMESVTSLDVSHFDTSNVTNMREMFIYMEKITSLDVTHFDTSKVMNMNNMFRGMSSLINIDVSHFDTSNVTNMREMFRGMSSLTNLDISNFDTRNVTDMGFMFNGMNKLTNLDLKNFDTSKVTDMSYMFQFMSSLTSLDLSKADFSKVINYNYMFYSVSKLNTIKVKDESAKTFIEARLSDRNITGVNVTLAS